MKNLVLLLFITILTAGCDVENFNKLPPATQEGKNTFGCLIDGEAVVARNGGWFDNAISAEVAPEYFRISGGGGTYVNCPDERIGVSFQVNSPSSLNDRVFQLTSISKSNFETYRKGKLVFCENTYYSFGESSGELIISKLDTINKIIAGTFWFDAKSQEGAIVEIRDGRFDITYIPVRN